MTKKVGTYWWMFLLKQVSGESTRCRRLSERHYGLNTNKEQSGVGAREA